MLGKTEKEVELLKKNSDQVINYNLRTKTTYNCLLIN